MVQDRMLFRRCREAMGLSAEGMARVLWVGNGRTVRRWEAGEREISGVAWRALSLILHERGDIELEAEILAMAAERREAA
jgi:DNA-binding transcriptional regulator YiaG